MSRWQPSRRRIVLAALLAVAMAVSTWIIPMYSVLAVFLSYDAGWAGVTATFALAAALMAVYRRRPAGSPVTHRS